MPDPLFCCIRKRWILATPEEKVRQSLITYLVNHLHYPLNYIIIEKGLHVLPHLDPAIVFQLPARRLDILVVAKDLHPDYAFYPVLLLECKATPLNPKAFRQVLGYNHFLKACFVGIANQKEIQMGWFDAQQNFVIHKNLPDYHVLCEQAKQLILNS